MSIMSRQGPYIPFEKPIPVPASLSDAAPLSSICFNSSWKPMVVGALKVLARPETWEGTDAEIRATMASAHDLIATAQSGCGAELSKVSWFPSPNDVLECVDSGTSLFAPLVLPGVFGTMQPLHLGSARETEGFWCSAFNFRDSLSFALCGGKIEHFFAWCTDATITPIWQLSWKDCLGMVTTDTRTGISCSQANFECQELCLSALHAFSFWILLRDPILCTVA